MKPVFPPKTDSAMNFSIRSFRSKDLIPVQKLIHDTIDACYAHVYPNLAVEYFKSFHSTDRIIDRSEQGQILVLELDGKIVATGSIVGAEIFAVFVNPALQGQGCGKRIMAELESIARKNLVTRIELSVSLPSRKFYEGLKYKLLDERSITLDEGQELKYWPATKRLP